MPKTDSGKTPLVLFFIHNEGKGKIRFLPAHKTEFCAAEAYDLLITVSYGQKQRTLVMCDIANKKSEATFLKRSFERYSEKSGAAFTSPLHCSFRGSQIGDVLKGVFTVCRLAKLENNEFITRGATPESVAREAIGYLFDKEFPDFQYDIEFV